MADKFQFTANERVETLTLIEYLRQSVGSTMREGDEDKLRVHLEECIEQNKVHRDVFGLNPILSGLQTARIVVEEIGLKRDAVLAILLHPSVEDGLLTIGEVSELFGESPARILHGLMRIAELDKKNPVIESENIRN